MHTRVLIRSPTVRWWQVAGIIIGKGLLLNKQIYVLLLCTQHFMGWTINYGYLWHGFFSKFTVELDNSCLMEWSFTCKFMAFKNSPGFLAVGSLLCWWMATIKRICQRCQVTTNDFGWAQAKVHLHFIKFSSIAVEFWLSNVIVPNWQS